LTIVTCRKIEIKCGNSEKNSVNVEEKLKQGKLRVLLASSWYCAKAQQQAREREREREREKEKERERERKRERERERETEIERKRADVTDKRLPQQQ
jgi:ribosomal protein L12E/L44/L45/RPP1/RPP2